MAGTHLRGDICTKQKMVNFKNLNLGQMAFSIFVVWYSIYSFQKGSLYIPGAAGGILLVYPTYYFGCASLCSFSILLFIKGLGVKIVDWVAYFVLGISGLIFAIAVAGNPA